MAFNSYSFLFLFFPIFFLLYRKLPLRWCLPLLCAGSLVFYAIGVWGRLWQLLLLLGMALFGFLGCLLFRRETLRKKWILALWLALTAAPLAYVKLAGLFLPRAPGLPLGLSFYTFQMIALLVFAWQGGFVSAGEYAAGVLMFPKLISGPLAEPEELLDELDDPRRSLGRLAEGLEDFILGLACKVVVADHLAGILGQIRVRGVGAVSVPLAWLGVIGYALQLYFDFWGYSRMAVGLGKLLGFRLPDNFNHPYCSTSVSEFWRRWHITLGRWFKTYVYIPLGGSRCGRLRTIFNIVLVWALTGLWHGASWNFVLWGLYFGLLLILERFVLRGLLARLPRFVCWLGSFALVTISWAIFYYTDLPAVAQHLAALFGAGVSGLWDAAAEAVVRKYTLYPLAAFFLSLPVVPALAKKLPERLRDALGLLLSIALLAASLLFLVGQSYNPFIYFRF